MQDAIMKPIKEEFPMGFKDKLLGFVAPVDEDDDEDEEEEKPRKKLTKKKKYKGDI